MEVLTMLRSYIYNEIKNAYTFSELFDIKNKIIRAEHFGHLDSKSADMLLIRCEKRFDDVYLIF
jgi:hypothetical protein